VITIIGVLATDLLIASPSASPPVPVPLLAQRQLGQVFKLHRDVVERAPGVIRSRSARRGLFRQLSCARGDLAKIPSGKTVVFDLSGPGASIIR
jgi:hypothetical protein